MAKKAANKSTPVVGDIFKKARAAQALSLDDVAAEICVRRCFLEAIEADDFSNMPGQTFAVGFAAAYAKYLGIDAASATVQFKAAFQAAHGAACVGEPVDANHGSHETNPSVKRAASTSSMPHTPTHQQNLGVERRKWPAWLSPIAGLVGATASWMFISAQMTASVSYTAEKLDSEDLEVQQLAAIQARYIEKDDSKLLNNILAAPKSSDDTAHGSDDTDTRGSLFFSAANAETRTAPSAGLAVSYDKITLHANEDSWLQLSYADGSALWSGVLRAGQDYTPHIIEDVFLTTSNAGGVLLSKGENRLGPIGERGEIVTDLALNGSALLDPGQPVSVAQVN